MTKRTASCTCGQLHIECSGEPVRVSICHCYGCQKRTGSPFSQTARFPRAQVELHGTAKTYVRYGDESGNPATFSFCPECGSTVHWFNGDSRDFVAVAVGAFADREFPGPVVSVYEERRHPWVNVDSIEQHMD